MKTRYIIFIVSAALILVYLLFLQFILNTNERVYKEQSNQEYNLTLTQNNKGFLGVCIKLAINDIEKQGARPNDIRIISYKYDQELVTIPHDTSDRFYSFKIFYTKQDASRLAMRAAAYKINFKEQIQRVYDVLAINEKAKAQVMEKEKVIKKTDSLIK